MVGSLFRRAPRNRLIERSRCDNRTSVIRSLRPRAALLLLGALVPLDAAARLVVSKRAIAVGAIEGTVTLPVRANAKTADRYFTDSGPRDIQAVPVVVYLEGAIASGAPARASGPTELIQRGEAFHPPLLVVPAGTHVRFPNHDPLFHNVFSYSRPKRFDLGRYRQGESKSVAFDRPGYIKVMCEVHKWMRAGILVVENGHYAIVFESGRFRMNGVPAGRYRMTVEHFDRRSTVDVEVPDGGLATVAVKL